MEKQSLRDFIRDKVDCYEEVVGENEPNIPDMVEFFMYEKAIDMIRKHIESGIIRLHADVDMDGIGCCYIMNTFLGLILDKNRVRACINKEKVHGLSDKHAKYLNSIKSDLVIIMDSSSNDIDIIKQINCDVLVIDHHDVSHNELSGNTAGGEYIIINNMIDNGDKYKSEPRMSGALVVYELLRQYQKKYMDEDVLFSNMLYQWVGVTLLTDVIPTGNLRNQWYMSNTVYKSDTEVGLNTLMNKIDSRVNSLNKSFINYKLAPMFNRAIRAGASAEALDIALNNQSEVVKLEKYKEVQDKIMDRVNYTLTNERIFDDTEKLDIVERDNYILCNLNNTGIRKSYTGLIASKMLDIKNKNAVGCIVEDIDKEFSLNGSFRGRYDTVDYRGIISSYGYFSEGHSNAFGIKVPAREMDDIMSKISEMESTIDNKPYVTAGEIIEQYRGKYHIADFNEFRKAGLLIRLAIANSKLSTREHINIVIANREFEVVKSGANWKRVMVWGLECWVFEELKTQFLNLYIEYSGEIKAYLKNRWV